MLEGLRLQLGGLRLQLEGLVGVGLVVLVGLVGVVGAKVLIHGPVTWVSGVPSTQTSDTPWSACHMFVCEHACAACACVCACWRVQERARVL